MPQAKLPNEFNESLIGNKQVGFVGYTVPWAMQVGDDDLCWLRAHMPAYRRSGGTVKMKVELREDGWHVWPPEGETWRPWDWLNEEPRGAIRFNDQGLVPVSEIHLLQKEETCQK
ncbi:MAG TPA: hypothetical protein VHD84_00880 [Candidatus Saccharimonadales bacterium]|nr:hypothetical protein [Candidatus Saccharimonadales bacterium]